MTRPRLVALAITAAVLLLAASGSACQPEAVGASTGRLAGTPTAHRGQLAWADAIHGPAYLAVPEGRGHWVRLCGAGGCLVARSNDAGPTVAMRQAGRVGDLGVRLWEFVCGVPRSRGLCEVTIEVGVELE